VKKGADFKINVFMKKIVISQTLEMTNVSIKEISSARWDLINSQIFTENFYKGGA
jgi:hypothetical protein